MLNLVSELALTATEKLVSRAVIESSAVWVFNQVLVLRDPGYYQI